MRTINLAHAAAAQQGSETEVPPENCAFMEANCRPAIQQGIAFCVAGEHPLNFRDQARISATGLSDKAFALGKRKLDGGLEDLANFAKLIRTPYTHRLRLVHRHSLAGSSMSVLRIEVERSSTYNNEDSPAPRIMTPAQKKSRSGSHGGGRATSTRGIRLSMWCTHGFGRLQGGCCSPHGAIIRWSLTPW